MTIISTMTIAALIVFVIGSLGPKAAVLNWHIIWSIFDDFLTFHHAFQQEKEKLRLKGKKEQKKQF